MSAKSSSSKPAKPKAAKASVAAKPKAAAKPEAKPKAAAKPVAKPMAAAQPKPVVKPAAKPKATKAGKNGPKPIEVVRPLIRVRQMREFSSKKVTKAELEAITEVARWSGSSRNEQPCRFVATRDHTLIRVIADFGLPQTRGLPTATAAIAIVMPDEPERENQRAFDDGRAAERILVAANMLGLGGGISRVRPDVRAGINKALSLPANRSVRTIVGIGHPTTDALAPKSRPGKARLPREEVIYNERWPEPPPKE